MKKYRISEITSSSIPSGPGIYSWYADLHLPEKDTEEVINLLLNEISFTRKENILREFLERKLFSPFVETPYKVKLEGKLKPLYTGILENKFNVSDSLIQSFLEDPSRLRGFQQVLKNLNISFLSPIYIGMASKYDFLVYQQNMNREVRDVLLHQNLHKLKKKPFLSFC